MNLSGTELFLGILLAIALNLPGYLKARRNRRLAEVESSRLDALLKSERAALVQLRHDRT